MASHFVDKALDRQMPPSRKLLLAAIADSASWETRISAPGADRMMSWAGVGKSQYQALITELVNDHLVVRHRPGVKGRKAEYIVFPHGCCAEHGPLPEYGPMPEPAQDHAPGQPDPSGAVDNPGDAPGQPDPSEAMGPAMGPVMQPVQTGPLPSYVPTENSRERESHVGDAREEEPPSSSQLVGEGPAGAGPPPARCADHLSDLSPPPCRACGAAREASQAWAERARLRAAEAAQRAREVEARARADAAAEVRGCSLCDADGHMLAGPWRCEHDVAANARKLAAREEMTRLQETLAARSAGRARAQHRASVEQAAKARALEADMAAAQEAAVRARSALRAGQRARAAEASAGGGRTEQLGA